ncbi:DUF397 domain-containing protein [Sphaerisporangium sp. NPDC005289]|uniref:DUF397 domain-containing protein n=1 Tax=Sphaerisporangium sp. NPDC005289 TaxID=3155247 RepID=UPI0033B68EB2
MDLDAAVWRKSSRSSDNGGQCVEVADNLPGVVAVRDSKVSDGPRLVADHSGWRTFIGSIKAGKIVLLS